ncbi:Gag-Pol polyprotein, partial [Frankliniella fusca]
MESVQVDQKRMMEQQDRGCGGGDALVSLAPPCLPMDKEREIAGLRRQEQRNEASSKPLQRSAGATSQPEWNQPAEVEAITERFETEEGVAVEVKVMAEKVETEGDDAEENKSDEEDVAEESKSVEDESEENEADKEDDDEELDDEAAASFIRRPSVSTGSATSSIMSSTSAVCRRAPNVSVLLPNLNEEMGADPVALTSQRVLQFGDSQRVDMSLGTVVLGDADLYRLMVALSAPQVLESAGVSFERILELLDEHWEEEISEAMAEFVFEQRRRKPGESAADWLADLRQLAIPCKFTDLDRRLRAQLVRGVADKECQRKLLEAPDLTVKSALNIIRVHMRTQAECEALSKRGSTEPEVREATVMYVNKPSNTTNDCFRCGARHDPEACWAREAECRKCGKRGHLGRRCRSSWKKGGSSSGQGGAGGAPVAQGGAKVNMLRTQPVGAGGGPEASEEARATPSTTRLAYVHEAAGAAASAANGATWEYTLCQVRGGQKYPSPDMVELKVDGQVFQAVLDNGAPCGMMSLGQFRQHWAESRLRDDADTLSVWSGQAVKGQRHCEVTVSVGQQEARLPLLVAEGDGPFLIGRLWLDRFGFRVSGPAYTQPPPSPRPWLSAPSPPEPAPQQEEARKPPQQDQPDGGDELVQRLRHLKLHLGRVSFREEQRAAKAKALVAKLEEAQVLAEEVGPMEDELSWDLEVSGLDSEEEEELLEEGGGSREAATPADQATGGGSREAATPARRTTGGGSPRAATPAGGSRKGATAREGAGTRGGTRPRVRSIICSTGGTSSSWADESSTPPLPSPAPRPAPLDARQVLEARRRQEPRPAPGPATPSKTQKRRERRRALQERLGAEYQPPPSVQRRKARKVAARPARKAGEPSVFERLGEQGRSSSEEDDGEPRRP